MKQDAALAVNPRDIYVLQTYPEIASDGLSSVYHRVASLAPVVADSKHLSDATVLVPGIPGLYLDRISANNRNVCYTTFESSQLPSHWTFALNNNFAACCVPHESVRQVFTDSGVTIPVFVVQQGYNRFPVPRVTESTNQNLRVGFLGVPVVRKNLSLLFTACKVLRDSGVNVQLVVHVPFYYDWMHNDNLATIRESPFVEWTEGFKNQQQLSDWFGSLACYAFPSSGEGWSFTPRESLALGIPTVVSDVPVHKELIDSEYVVAIKSSGSSAATMETSNSGSWCDIQCSDIRDALHTIVKDRQAALINARKGAKWIEHKWLNEDCCTQLQKVLTEL